MKKLLFLFLPLIFMSSKCNKECDCVTPPTPQGVINLNFKPIFNSKPFVINQIYTIDGKNVRFTRLSFLTTETCPNTSTNNLSCGIKAYLIDLTTLDDSTKSAKGFTQTLTQLTEGNMSGLQLSLGVSKTLNASMPKDFSSSNPLSDASLYWADWKSYIFVKLEGLMDKDGDGRFETGITLHTGGDESFRQTWYPQAFTVDTKGTTIINFDINVNTILRGIDLSIVNSTHQTGDKPTILKLMDNLKNAVTLK